MNTGGSNLNLPNHSSSAKDVLSKSFTNAFNASVSRMTTNQGLDTEGIKYDAVRDYDALVDNFDFTTDNALKEKPKGNAILDSSMIVGDEFKYEKSVMRSINNYRLGYRNLEIDSGMDAATDDTQEYYKKTIMTVAKVAPSLFNPMYGVNMNGISRNVPLLDGINNNDMFDENVQDCSISRLVELSNLQADGQPSPLGLATYKYADFMYCKNVGKVSNNHLITLRKFAIPVGDNIFKAAAIRGDGYRDNNISMMSDIGRMVTWFGTDDNKLEDIMSYEYDATFIQKEGKIQQLDSQEDDESRGIAGKIINTLSAGYNKNVGNGIGEGGILKTLFGAFGIDTKNATYANNDVALGRNYDNNKVYEPKDTVRDTYLYEGKLEFRHEFTLNFSYKLRAYDNINPKAAMLDLLGNILTTTYRRGKFWGGRSQILGPQPNQEGWNKYNKFIDRAALETGKLGGTVLDLLFNCNQETFGALMGQLSDVFNSAMEAVKDMASQVAGAMKDGTASAKMQNFIKKYGIGSAMTGLLKNKLGRPSLYAFDSILTGSNVGLWHVTIGNPLNPIAVFGNLIMTNCKITHTGPLGLDDFPTELKVAVTLKHGRGRDMIDISKMYTRGEQSVMLSLTSKQSNKKHVNENTLPIVNNKHNNKYAFIGSLNDWVANAKENE